MIPEPKKKIAVARHIEKILVGTRLRNLDEAKVLSFMDSIKAVGLKTPITVYGEEGDATVLLSAGGHRLEACTRLGMATILCFHEQGDETDRELWEIDENLIRSDLSVAERALFMARRKELHLIKYPETAKGVAQALASNAAQGRGGQVVRDVKSFAAATAEATGRDERSIRRDVERGEKISKSAIQQLIGTRHNNGVTLDHLKKIETAEAQEGYVRALLAADKAVQAESKLVRTAQQKQNRESRLNLIGAIAEHGAMAPPDNNDLLMHQQMGQLLEGMNGLKESIRRIEDGARRSEDMANASRAVVHKRMDELVNRVSGVEQSMAIVKEDVSEMKPVTEDVRQLEADAAKMKAAVADMKPVTDDVKRWKLMGVGGLTVMGIAGVSLGVSFADVLKRIAAVILGKI